MNMRVTLQANIQRERVEENQTVGRAREEMNVNDQEILQRL